MTIHSGTANLKSPKGKFRLQKFNGCVVCELFKIFSRYENVSYGIFDDPKDTLFYPTDFLYAVWGHAEHLAAYDQHDAHEFFHAVIHGFEHHLSCFHSNIFGLLNLETRNNWRECVFPSRSILLNDVYFGVLKSDLQCSMCKSTSSKLESFADISLGLEPKEGIYVCRALYCVGRLL